jgi:ribonuclease T1
VFPIGRPQAVRALVKAFGKSGLTFTARAGFKGVVAAALASIWAIAALTMSLGFGNAVAREAVTPGRVVALSALPLEAQRTDQLIHAGGPFVSIRDGVVFGNRERQLPQRPRGFYREYTVPTPGARNRGARRIVCGGRQPTAPEACFYTNDHYATFRRIVD